MKLFIASAIVAALFSSHAFASNDRDDKPNSQATSGAQAGAQAGAVAGAISGSVSGAMNSTAVRADTQLRSETQVRTDVQANPTAIGGASTSFSSSTSGASTSVATADGGKGGASQASVTFNAPAQPAETRATIKAAPDMYVAGPASGPCTGFSGGVGASWLGGGLGINAATVDDACTRRENIRILSMLLPTLSGGDAVEVRALIMSMVREMAPAAKHTAPTVTAALPVEVRP